MQDVALSDRMQPVRFYEEVIVGRYQQGRFLVSGRNGAGKTSLLKAIKGPLPEAMMLGAGIELGNKKVIRSAGQRSLALLEMVLKNSVGKILLLDEWDAVLDMHNSAKIDQWLDELAQSNVILEIRHKRRIKCFFV